MDFAEAVVSRKGVARIQRGHPWVFRSDVYQAPSDPPGAVVRVLGPGRRPLGFALFSRASEITLRVIERGTTLPADWLERRLDEALAFRRGVAAEAEALRLVHGEGDALPSLVVDRYGDYLVLQTLSQGMELLKEAVVRHLVARLAPRGILERNDPRVRQLEGLPQQVNVVAGEVPETVEVTENGLHLAADLRHGQKTGLFLDQRENHAVCRAYATGRVLDAFSYNGGFALHAASVADEVLACDVSAEAVARIRANAQRNNLANVTAREANAFDLLRELEQRGERFDTVILDPPAFAKSRDAVAKAWRGYKEINLRALRQLAPGGILATYSCSHHVQEADFRTMLAEAAADAKRHVQVLEFCHQPPDHPVLVTMPESEYLRGCILRVE